MEEVEKLKTEIKILNKRLSILEGKERRRSAFKHIKFFITLLFIAALTYGIWYAYDYITNYIPNQIENGINELIPEAFR